MQRRPPDRHSAPGSGEPAAEASGSSLPSAAIEPAGPRRVSLTGTVDRCRVLVADDARDNADSMSLVLRAAGHEVITVYDGDSALAAAERQHPDVVVLDLCMPQVDGHEAGRRIRSAPWGRDLLLIALSGHEGPEARRASAASGFDHHLVKPVDPRRLLSLISPDALTRTA